MSTIRYTYSVLRYVHDAVADEALNIGVVLFAPEGPAIEVRLDEHYKRLGSAFVSFKHQSYKGALKQFRVGAERIGTELRQRHPALFARDDVTGDAGTIVRKIWPDQELCFRGGPVRVGRTFDLAAEADHLFQRYVTSQYERHKEERRSNEDVWAVYRKPLAPVSFQLEPHTFSTPNFALEIPHAFKNGAWHALQPLSFDLLRPENITKKAAQWHGNLALIQDNPDLAKIYFLLGRPEDEALLPEYEKAKNILSLTKVPHELVEEDQAEGFGEELTVRIRSLAHHP